MREIPPVSILVSLDDLLDTRLGAIDLIDPKASFSLLHHKVYLNRHNDNWEKLTKGLITNKQFKNVYDNRNMDVLRRAKLTGNAVWLKEFTNLAEMQTFSDPLCGLPVIDVNTWPYEVPEKYLENLRAAIKYQCASNMTTVNFVCQPIETLTPKFLKESYQYFFIYELEKWKEMHREELIVNKIPSVVVHAPKLFIDEPLPPHEITPDDENTIDPFKAAELMMFEYMHLSMLPVYHWSIVLP